MIQINLKDSVNLNQKPCYQQYIKYDKLKWTYRNLKKNREPGNVPFLYRLFIWKCCLNKKKIIIILQETAKSEKNDPKAYCNENKYVFPIW